MKDHGDFYIGYQNRAPESLARTLRKRILVFSVVALVSALLLAWGHRAYRPSIFEFTVSRSFEGILSQNPYPSLLITRPGDTGNHPPFSRFLLVAPGKFGAEELIEEHVGQTVQLTGNLLYQDGRSMIEIDPGSIAPLKTAATANSVHRELGTHTLRGEIVDSKCYLGAMNPGNLKTHKACAIRCISGGIPPVFLVRNAEDGTALYFMLVDENGGAVNQRVLDLVAEPLLISGNVVQEDDMLILKANPDDYVLME